MSLADLFRHTPQKAEPDFELPKAVVHDKDLAARFNRMTSVADDIFSVLQEKLGKDADVSVFDDSVNNIVSIIVDRESLESQYYDTAIPEMNAQLDMLQKRCDSLNRLKDECKEKYDQTVSSIKNYREKDVSK